MSRPLSPLPRLTAAWLGAAVITLCTGWVSAQQPPAAQPTPPPGEVKPPPATAPEVKTPPARQLLPKAPRPTQRPPRRPPRRPDATGPTRPLQRPPIKSPEDIERQMAELQKLAECSHYTDEQGRCRFYGPTDRPKDINLFHGLLGTTENKSEVEAPPEPRGSWEWWKWRLTPTWYRYDNHDCPCDPQNEPTPLIANIINFGALVFLFVWFGKKPLREALRKRKESIMSEIDKAKSIKKKAQQRLDHYEAELDQLDQKLVNLKGQYAADAERERGEIETDGERNRQRLLADVEQRLRQEARGARDELSKEALMSALRAAEELIKERLTKADQERIAEEYLDHIGPALAEPGQSPEPGDET